MFPIVCFSSLLFGTWLLIWNEKSGRYETCYYLILIPFVLFGNIYQVVSWVLTKMINDNTLNSKPQYLILILTYFNYGILLINRLANGGRSAYFANELYATCGLTVESARRLPEFCARAFASAVVAGLLQYKYTRYTDIAAAEIAMSLTIPVMVCATGDSVMEWQYSCACAAIAVEFDAVNRRAEDAATAGSFAAAAADHCRLVRMVRLFNEEYGAPLLLTTLNLLMGQIYTLNDAVTVIVHDDRPDQSYGEFTFVFNTVHLASKIMLGKDINSYAEHTRKLALDFLDQLLHRRIRISAWGFYDVNKELLFAVLGYQFGLCLIFSQFSTSSAGGAQHPTTINQTTIIGNTSTTTEGV